MSLVKLADGQRFEIEPPTGTRTGILRQRERNILPLVLKADGERFDEIRQAFLATEKTETITIYFPDEKETATDAQLEGVAHEIYEGFTIPGDVKESDIVTAPGTLTSPPVFGRQLTIELGQRQYGE